jgi:Na+-driven multidrug efflux pump
MMLLSVLFFLAAVFVLPPLFGNHGLWAALHIFLLARGFTLLAVLRERVRGL